MLTYTILHYLLNDIHEQKNIYDSRFIENKSITSAIISRQKIKKKEQYHQDNRHKKHNINKIVKKGSRKRRYIRGNPQYIEPVELEKSISKAKTQIIIALEITKPINSLSSFHQDYTIKNIIKHCWILNQRPCETQVTKRVRDSVMCMLLNTLPEDDPWLTSDELLMNRRNIGELLLDLIRASNSWCIIFSHLVSRDNILRMHHEVLDRLILDLATNTDMLYTIRNKDIDAKKMVLELMTSAWGDLNLARAAIRLIDV